MTLKLGTLEEAVDLVLTRAGRRLVVGTPLGIGKPNPLVNALFARAKLDPTIDLRLFTALSLSRPRAGSELERRLLEPLVARLFGDYPELDYVGERRSGRLPANVHVHEFYLQPARELNAAPAQQDFVCTNYSDVLRDLREHGVNVLLQLVAGPRVEHGQERYSLSANPDLSFDLLRDFERAGRRGSASVALTNQHLPFMLGDAVVDAEAFDGILDQPALDYPPFATPYEAVSLTDYAIGLNASVLVPDAGTLQLGIGSLGDAIAHLLLLRHRDNAVYADVVARLGVAERHSELISAWGGLGRFEQGLYAATEMLAVGFYHLYRGGVLKRRVVPDPRLQRVLNETELEGRPSVALLRALVGAGLVELPLDDRGVETLRDWGVLRPDVELDGGELACAAGRTGADLRDPEGLEPLLGAELSGARIAHAGFFLGPRELYDGLRDLPDAERERFEMTRIGFVNQLFGEQEDLKRLQRRRARFLNTGLLATLYGAVTSDGLEDGRVLSGVGGQFDFVAMANELSDGRSILMIRATRSHGARVTSNVLPSYGHTTIPRQLRDIVVTEYGIADLRGKSDREVVLAMAAIADARFQDGLLESARRSGKVGREDRLPERCRENTPEALERALAPLRRGRVLPSFPFGSELASEEQVLARALRRLRQDLLNRRYFGLAASALKGAGTASELAPYLERMGLDRPSSVRERLLRRAVILALSRERDLVGRDFVG